MTENKKLIDPKEHEIKLSFHNYKLLKKEEFNLKGSCIYFVKGPNGVGKTTILNGLKAAQEIKDNTPEKLTRGESEGRNEFQIPGPDGKTYLVAYEFNQSKIKFIVIDEDGKKIDRVTDMREIFGYQHISAKEFISWSRSAEGRRKQKQFILDLLPPESYLEYNELERNEEEAFNERRKVNKEVDETSKILNEFKLTDEEQAMFKQEDKARKLLEKYEQDLKNALPNEDRLDALREKHEILKEKENSISDNLTNTLSDNNRRLGNIDIEIERLTKTIESLKQEKEEISKDTNNLKKEYKEHIETIKDEQKNVLEEIEKLSGGSEEDIGKLRESIEHGKEFLNKIERLHDRMDRLVKYRGKYDELVEQAQELDHTVKQLRKDKENIIESGEFPVESLSFDDEGYLIIDGFRFDEDQVCESDTILLVSEILCKTNKSVIQIIGDASVLDFEKLDKLNDIAEQNGKVMFVDEVDRDISNLVIVGYEDVRTTKTKPAKAKEKKAEDKKEEEDDKPLF